MKTLRLIGYTIAALLAENCPLLVRLLGLPPISVVTVSVGAAGLLLLICVRPTVGRYPSRRLRELDGGMTLVETGLASETISAGLAVWAGAALMPERLSAGAMMLHAAVILVCACLLYLAGLLRIFGVSVQMGLRKRLKLLFFWWVPGINLLLFAGICRTAGEEFRVESAKCELDEARAGSAVCRTQYPLLLVHGVFFRDSRFFNYWGRIPAELIRNGASVFYGEQQSAASVADSAKELAERIKTVAVQNGGKVNVIAHSKGGLDARWAISCLGAAPYVASLTTINTPHRGCLFAETLLKKTSRKFQQELADAYNSALQKLGDTSPDFLAAVNDLTQSACARLNERATDQPDILYESVGSKVRRARSGQFPLNVSYPLVRHYDGENDGLVAVEAAKWGASFTLLTPKGRRGISHGDVIDLNRENIPGFDVREFYVGLVHRLKERGY